jgi:hypothetical protein
MLQIDKFKTLLAGKSCVRERYWFKPASQKGTALVRGECVLAGAAQRGV